MIKIKCLLINSISKYNIKIYKSNKLIINKNTNCYGITYVHLNKGYYKIKIKSLKYNICYSTNFFINNITEYLFFTTVCQNRTINSSTIFKLTDSNYKNLPIEKGIINLWQI